MSEPKFSVGEEVVIVGSHKGDHHGCPYEATINEVLPLNSKPWMFSGLRYYDIGDFCIAEILLRKKPNHQPADADWQEDFNRILNPKRVYSKQTKAVGDE